MVAYINDKLADLQKEGVKTGVIATDETAGSYLGGEVKSAGKRQDEEEVAEHLFKILREFDDDEVQVMFAESFPQKGIGQAIMNRLLKAAGHQVVHLDPPDKK